MKRKKARKTQVIGLRLTERQRFEIDLISEVLPGNPTITGIFEWAVQTACANTPALADITKVWSEHESDRFVRTAHFYPEALDDSEQRLWHFISYRNEFWLMDSRKDINYFHFMLLRLAWDMVRAHILNGQPFDEEKFEEAYEAAPGLIMAEPMERLQAAGDEFLAKLRSDRDAEEKKQS